MGFFPLLSCGETLGFLSLLSVETVLAKFVGDPNHQKWGLLFYKQVGVAVLEKGEQLALVELEGRRNEDNWLKFVKVNWSTSPLR
jgi:hypothetical protein